MENNYFIILYSYDLYQNKFTCQNYDNKVKLHKINYIKVNTNMKNLKFAHTI